MVAGLWCVRSIKRDDRDTGWQREYYHRIRCNLVEQPAGSAAALGAVAVAVTEPWLCCWSFAYHQHLHSAAHIYDNLSSVALHSVLFPFAGLVSTLDINI